MSLPESRSDPLDRPQDAQWELEQELNKLSLDQRENLKGLTLMTESLPIPFNVDALQHEPFTEVTEILKTKSGEELCALFEEEKATGILLVLVAQELKRRIQERELTAEQEMLLAMSYLHMSSQGMERRYPASVAEVPAGLVDMISEHNKLLAALDQLKHGGLPTVIDRARKDITTIFEKQQDHETVQMHIRALRVYFEQKFGGQVDKSYINRAQEMLFTFAKVENPEMREFLLGLAERHPTEEIRMAAIHALVYLDNAEDRKRIAKHLPEEQSPYVAGTIMSVLQYCIHEYNAGTEEKQEIRTAIEAYRAQPHSQSSSAERMSEKLMKELEAA